MTSQFLNEYQKEWGAIKTITKDIKTCTLLQRAILRNVLEKIHSQQSFALAISDDYVLNEIREQEKKIQKIRNLKNFENFDLNELLSKDINNKDVAERKFPKEFLLKFGINQLANPFANPFATPFERLDRKWEKELALDAIEANWEFWSLKALISIQNAEKLNNQLIKNLWPNGILLYTETDLSPKTQPIPGESWAGKWLIVMIPSQNNEQYLKEKTENNGFLQRSLEKIYP